MVQKKKSKNRFGITPSIIFLNLLLVLIVCTVCFFTYNIINDDNGESSLTSDPPFTKVTSAPAETEKPASQTTAVSSEASSPASSDDNQPTVDFDKDYFNSSLFIGDSISTGLSLYGFLDSDNVFAQQGLAPSTALDAEIDGVSLSAKIASFKPKKVFIMLGTNSVGYADTETLTESMKELAEKITKLCSANVYVISIPPITKEAENDANNALTTSSINEYNTMLKESLSGTDATFLDFHSVLVDSDGYFTEEYAEMDGIHFTGKTYEVMLSYLQKHSS